MRTAITLTCAVWLGAAAPSSAQPVKIGFLDAQRIEIESVQARRAQETLKREFGPREREILALQKQIEADRVRFDKERAKLSPAELKTRGNAIAESMRRSDQMALAMAEDLERRKRELGTALVEEARAAIKVVAEAGKFDLILQQAIFRHPAIDVTDQVLKEMARRAGSAR